MLGEIYDAVFHVLGLFCHQLPERSLVISGVQFPLCIRCTAMLLGAGAALVYLVTRMPLPSAGLSFIMILPTVIEMSATGMGWTESTNWIRGVNGSLTAFFFLIGSMVWLAGRPRNATRPPRRSPPGMGSS
jgi:uncharacterized membrane protein